MITMKEKEFSSIGSGEPCCYSQFEQWRGDQRPRTRWRQCSMTCVPPLPGGPLTAVLGLENCWGLGWPGSGNLAWLWQCIFDALLVLVLGDAGAWDYEPEAPKHGTSRTRPRRPRCQRSWSTLGLKEKLRARRTRRRRRRGPKTKERPPVRWRVVAFACRWAEGMRQPAARRGRGLHAMRRHSRKFRWALWVHVTGPGTNGRGESPEGNPGRVDVGAGGGFGSSNEPAPLGHFGQGESRDCVAGAGGGLGEHPQRTSKGHFGRQDSNTEASVARGSDFSSFSFGATWDAEAKSASVQGVSLTQRAEGKQAGEHCTCDRC